MQTRFLLTITVSTFLLGLSYTQSYAAYPQPVAAQHAMVVTAQHLATDVGVNVLKQGGNAIDAAVAVGYALAVVYPCCGNIGGGGFMTIRFANGQTTFINFREKAPLAASANMYLDKNGNIIPNSNIYGYKAVGVPGTVMGLDYALKKYGTLSRQQVMAPAIQLAQKGFTLGSFDAMRLAKNSGNFVKQPNVAAIFLNHGQAFKANEKLVQPQLAKTLQLISQNGTDAFYRGIISEKIVAASSANGGLLTQKDFDQYTVEEMKPITCQYRGYDVISAPPPSSGGVTLCEMLNILEKYPLGFFGFHSANSVHYIAEAMRFSFFDRNNSLGDPDFVQNPIEKLTSKAYAQTIQNEIQPYRATPSDTLGNGIQSYENYDTTHYSIVDQQGNAVSVTYTLNNFFGANVIAGDTGFLLNDEMDDFTPKVGSPNQFGLVQGANNAIAPGKRPLSSMSPTIISKGNQLFMVVGSPGGPRIITTILEVILNVIDYGMDIQAAVDSPRIHQQWLPDVVYMEPGAISADTLEKLSSQGYQFTIQAPWDAAESILYDQQNKILYGANDDRRPEGEAKGY